MLNLRYHSLSTIIYWNTPSSNTDIAMIDPCKAASMMSRRRAALPQLHCPRHLKATPGSKRCSGTKNMRSFRIETTSASSRSVCTCSTLSGVLSSKKTPPALLDNKAYWWELTLNQPYPSPNRNTPFYLGYLSSPFHQTHIAEAVAVPIAKANFFRWALWFVVLLEIGGK